MLGIDGIKYLFRDVKNSKTNSFNCLCPAHNDKKASLTVTEKDGKLLFKCHAGCDYKQIIDAVGLTEEDIGNKRKNDKREMDWRVKFEGYTKQRIEATYNYYNENNEYLYTKIRLTGKIIRYCRIINNNKNYEYGKGDKEATLYKLPELIKAIRNEKTIYIVEGEKDVDTLRKNSLYATTAGSVSDWKQEYARYFLGARVVILPDNDAPGKKLAEEILKDLKKYCISLKVVTISSLDKGDITDFLTKEKKTIDDFLEKVREAPGMLPNWLYSTKTGEKVNTGILAKTINDNLKYLVVRRANEEKDAFYIYKHGVYELCNKATVKSYIRKYIPCELITDSKLNDVYEQLKTFENCIHSYEELDKNEKYINVRNGLYNIETEKLEPHNYNILSTIQLDCIYDKSNVERKVFEKFIEDFCFDVDKNKVDIMKAAVLQEFAGLLISNVAVHRAKKCLVLYSPQGNTGKTQFINLITSFLGYSKITNVPMQQMNEASKFALGDIIGKRLVCVGDQTGSEIKDSSVFKQLTGGDAIKVEAKSKQPFPYIFKGGIIIACNNLPSFGDDKGTHIFERMCIVPCQNTIQEEKRDAKLLDKMLNEKTGILNWCLEGLGRIVDANYKFTKSESCDETSKEYRVRLDTVYQFITEERYVITNNHDDKISKAEFDKNYVAWCEENDRNAVNKQNIKTRMDALGCKQAKANIGDKRGVTVYRGIKEAAGEDFKVITKEEQQAFPF